MGGPDIDTALDWQGRTVADRSGEKIGKLEEIFLDAESGIPAWGSVGSGLFGRRQSLLPLGEVEAGEDQLRVPFDKDHVLGAPQTEPDVELSRAEEEALYGHYGLDYSSGSGEGEEEAEGGLIRSEEEVDVRTEARPRERLRLKKYVVTEHVTKKVPVRREKIAVEREPVGDEAEAEDAPSDGPQTA
jgi:sporulation protein YlmC with PRC-barrel domain